MDTALPDACITGHQRLLTSLSLPDPDDRHVLAAAIRAKAQVIVTYNERDFPAATLTKFDLTAQHPDNFLLGLVNYDPDAVSACLLKLHRRLKNPPMTVVQVIDMIGCQSVESAGAALRRFLAKAH